MSGMTIQEALHELEKPSDVLVIGNGFDMHCGLRSSFKDFFDSELRYKDRTLNVKKIKNNIWYLIFTFAFMLDSNHGGKLVPYVNNSNPLWMDVESYIDKVFRTKNLMGELEIYNFILNKLSHNPDPQEYFLDNYFINGDYKNQPFHIGHRVNELREMFKKPEDLLMFELKNFEKDFANYLEKEINAKKDVYERNIGRFVGASLDNHGTNEVFILSFNYSHNFANDIKNENIVNAHGTLQQNNIIIGIGDYEKGGLPGRDNFKKVKRRVEYNYGPIKLPSNENVKSVIFYGCSFSKQDWNYYKLIFKKYGLENQKVVFKFLYSDYSLSPIDNEKNRTKYRCSCTEVVNSYLQENNSSFNFEDLYNL